MYIQKKITLSGAQTDYDVRTNYPELWAGSPASADYISDLLIAADVDITVKLNSTVGDGFPVKCGTLGQIFQETAGNVKNIYVSSAGTVNLNFLVRKNP